MAPPPTQEITSWCTFNAKNRLYKSSRWWSSDKNLESRDLLSLWSQVQTLWLLIWWPLEAYMVVNFKTCRISGDAYKLARKTTLN
jgi:hypothetical protein